MSAITKNLTLENVTLLILPISVALIIARLARSQRPRTTKLNGPPSSSYLFGVVKDTFEAPDLGVLYENWESEYGPIYEIPSTLGSKLVVLCDPKAIAHYFSKDTFTYYQPSSMKSFISRHVSSPFIFHVSICYG